MRVSLYIVNFNQFEYLERAIQSAFSQTWKDIEYILVDNNSDSADRVLADLTKRYKFDRVLRRNDSNLKRAANEVLSISTGTYVVRLDADDYLHESAVQLMVEKAKAESADFVSTDYFLVDRTGETIGQFYKNSVIDFAKRPDIPMHGACCLIRTAFLRQNGGYNVDVLMQDGYDVWLALSGVGRGAHINLPLFSYRRHSKNISNDSDKLIEARRAMLTAHCPELPTYSLNYFMRKPLQEALPKAKEIVAGLDSSLLPAPNGIFIHCAGETESISEHWVSGRRVVLVERSDPEMLEKNAIREYLRRFENKRDIVSQFHVCLYFVSSLSKPIVEGVLRTAKMFEADVVHSVRRETMNLYYHDGVGLQPLSDSAHFTSERSIIYKRYPVCDVYRADSLLRLGSHAKIGHFLLQSREIAGDTDHGWDIA